MAGSWGMTGGGAAVVERGGCPWPYGTATGSHRSAALRDEGVAGLVDGGGDVGTVDRLGGSDGDRAGGEVDGDRLDAVDTRDLLGDCALAVRAGHAGDGEGGGADERVRCAGQHGNSSRGRVVR